MRVPEVKTLLAGATGATILGLVAWYSTIDATQASIQAATTGDTTTAYALLQTVALYTTIYYFSFAAAAISIMAIAYIGFARIMGAEIGRAIRDAPTKDPPG